MKSAAVTALAAGLGLLATSSSSNGTAHRSRLAAFDAPARALLARMTLDEKIGQMTQAEQGQLDLADIETYFLGSVLSGGNADPATNSFADWRDMYDRH